MGVPLPWWRSEPGAAIPSSSRTSLMDAMLSIAAKPHPRGRLGLIHAIQRQQTLEPSPNIEDVWRPASIRKIQPADATWPLLERGINRAIARGNHGPPIMGAALRAYELALLSYRRTIALTRRRSRLPTP